jgi:hypothetical protein
MIIIADIDGEDCTLSVTRAEIETATSLPRDVVAIAAEAAIHLRGVASKMPCVRAAVQSLHKDGFVDVTRLRQSRSEGRICG